MTRLFFPEAHRKDLTIVLLKRVPILINLNILLIFYFLFASVTRFRVDPVGMRTFLIAINLTSITFLISLLLIRLRHYISASTVSTLGILINSLWIGILLPAAGAADLYRLAVYIFASSIVNTMLSIYKKQIVIYAILGYLVLLLPTVFIYAPRMGGLQGELLTVFMTMTILYIPVALVFWFTNKLASDVIAIAEVELDKNRQRAQELDRLIQKAKGTMEIGKTLMDCAAESKNRSNAIKEAFEQINKATKTMSGQSRCADESNQEVVDFANKMQDAVNDQNAFLEQTSTAITEIMTTIQNIAHLADDKKSLMNSMLEQLQTQGKEVNRVMEGFAKIRSSSREVLAVVSGILDVSEKTNMLAMNASIEAAHAGNSGKGFAVIAGEIRKLSQETQSNTHSISQALAKNDQVVNDAAGIVSKYTVNTESVIKDIQSTFNAIEEIISGLAEIASGTRELTDATGRMISVAHDTSDRVDGVTHKVKESSDAVAQISDFACQLDTMIDSLYQDFRAIETVLDQVHAVGEQNISNIRNLEIDLDRISE